MLVSRSTQQFIYEVDQLISNRLVLNYHTKMIAFIVDEETNQCHLFTTNKFSDMMNIEITNSLLSMSSTETPEPSSVVDAMNSYKKVVFPLEKRPYSGYYPPSQYKSREEQSRNTWNGSIMSKEHYQNPSRYNYYSQRFDNDTSNYSFNDSSTMNEDMYHNKSSGMNSSSFTSGYTSDITTPKTVTSHEVSGRNNDLEFMKERIQAMPKPMRSVLSEQPRRRNKCQSPKRFLQQQNVQMSIDDTTKMKVIYALYNQGN